MQADILSKQNGRELLEKSVFCGVKAPRNARVFSESAASFYASASSDLLNKLQLFASTTGRNPWRAFNSSGAEHKETEKRETDGDISKVAFSTLLSKLLNETPTFYHNNFEEDIGKGCWFWYFYEDLFMASICVDGIRRT